MTGARRDPPNQKAQGVDGSDLCDIGQTVIAETVIAVLLGRENRRVVVQRLATEERLLLLAPGDQEHHRQTEHD